MFLYIYFPSVLRSHVKRHIRYRFFKGKRCLENTECYACGCDTPGVFFASKGCEALKYLKQPACYPRISRYMWSKLEHDFGDIQPGKISTIFTYFGPKSIKKVYASCGCTSHKESDTEGNVDIEITFNAREKRKPYTSTKHITVTFEDGTSDVLKISANVQTRIRTASELGR